jgi:hypothetical protein
VINLIRKVLPIAIEADHHLGVELARSAKAGIQGSAFALIAFMADQGGTCRTSDLSCIVSGAIINYDHLAGKSARLEDDTTNTARFIVRRDDDDQVRVGVVGCIPADRLGSDLVMASVELGPLGFYQFSIFANC